MVEKVPASLVRHHGMRGVWRTFDVTAGMFGGVTGICQDGAGHLWLTTTCGLCRFDGQDFVYFSAAQGLPAHPLSSICLDSEGRMWVGSLGGGICCFDGERASLYTKEDGLVDDDVAALQVDTEDRVWIATWNHGASCYDKGRFRTITTSDGLAENSLRSILCDHKGHVWFGTNASGVGRFDGKRFTTYRTEHGLLHNRVQCMTEDHLGRVWMGTAHGLNCYDNGHFASIARADGLPEQNIRYLYEDAEGSLWIGFQRMGLGLVQGERVSLFNISHGLLHNNVSVVLRDREGLVWCGHPHVGLSCVDIQSVEPLSDSPVTETMLRDCEGRLWFGSDNDVVCLMPDGAELRRNLAYRVYAMLLDRLGRLWIGTAGLGLLRFDNPHQIWDDEPADHRVVDLADTDVVCLYESTNGDVWAGTAHPGHLVQFHNDVLALHATSNVAVYRIAEDDAGKIWYCGGGAHWAGAGLCTFDGTAISRYTDADGLMSNAVKSLAFDPQGRLWIGTQRGLCFREAGEFRHLNADDHGGFAPEHQCSAVDHDGRPWFGTLGGGVYRYDGTHFQRITTEDGLPSNEVSGLVPDDDGSMLIGTYRGLVRYRPMSSRAPVVSIRKVLADRVYHTPASLELTTTQARLVSVVFRGTSLSAHRLRYSYQLENHDDEWKDTWLTEATFENLPIGEYTLRVRAVNRDFVPSSNTAALHIKVVADPLSRLLAEHRAEIGRMEQEMKSRRRSERLNQALAELVRSKTFDEFQLGSILRQVTETACRSLDVHSVSIWLSDGKDVRIRCAERFEQDKARHSRGDEIILPSGMAVFSAVEKERVLNVVSAYSDPRTTGIPEVILPRTATSALLTAVWQRGHFRGLVVHAHSGDRRKWSPDECNFAGFVGDFVALALEREERRRAEQALHETQEEDRRFQHHLMTLYELSTDLSKLETFEEICRTAVSEGCQRLDFENLSLWFKDKDLNCLVGSYSVDEFGRLRDRRGERAKLDAPWLLGRLNKEILGAYRIADAPLYTERGDFVRMGMRAVAPLTDGEDVTGYLVTDNLPQGRPITDHQTELLGLLATALGQLAMRRRAEEERRQLEAQIQQSQRLEALGVLAGGIAHDFNNILAAIFGHTTLAIEEVPADGLIAASLEQVLRAGTRAKELVQQILAFSRRSGQEFKPVALAMIIEETLQFARASLPAPIEIVRTIDLPSAFIRGNPTQLHQVVMNLCANAAQAIGAQGGVIEVRLEALDVDEPIKVPAELHAGRYAKLTVRDTGCGISPDVVERIFEPFYTTKAPGEGTGMGLAVVHGIVVSHGGAIAVESTPGEGTAFHIFFPRIDEPAVSETKTTKAHSTGSERILFVDDEEPLLQLATRLLGHLGYHVTTAPDGAAALDLFEASPDDYDLVVTDRLMPKMTGEVLAKHISALRPDVPILLTTGHFDYIEQDQVRAFGIADILPKPYSSHQISSMVRQVLDSARPRR